MSDNQVKERDEKYKEYHKSLDFVLAACTTYLYDYLGADENYYKELEKALNIVKRDCYKTLDYPLA